MLYKLIVILSVTVLSGCAVVHKVDRHRITGQVLDATTKLPLKNVNVEETQTNSQGFFELPEKCSYALVMFRLEAGALGYHVNVTKKNYERVIISYFDGRGDVTSCTNEKFTLKPIYLKRKSNKPNETPYRLINSYELLVR